MIRYKIAILLIFIWFFAFQAFAAIEVEKRFVRFQGKTVSVEDPVGHLIDTFGEPYHKEKQTNWVRLRRNRVVERDVFLCFYRLTGEHGGEIITSSSYTMALFRRSWKSINQLGLTRNLLVVPAGLEPAFPA